MGQTVVSDCSPIRLQMLGFIDISLILLMLVDISMELHMIACYLPLPHPLSSSCLPPIPQLLLSFSLLFAR